MHTPTHQNLLLTHKIKVDENVIFVIPFFPIPAHTIVKFFFCISFKKEANNNEQCGICRILPMREDF